MWRPATDGWTRDDFVIEFDQLAPVWPVSCRDLVNLVPLGKASRVLFIG